MQFVPKNQKEVVEQNQVRAEKIQHEEGIKSKKKSKIMIISAIVFLVLISIGAYAYISPGKYDEFAKCLSEKGAVMLGEDWCQYTQGQKAMFGKSFKYITYIQQPGLDLRPTWEIDGKTYQKVQSFQTLSALTGCKY